MPFAAGAGILILVLSALNVIFGFGLLQGAPWARIFGIILNIINLINVSTVGVSTNIIEASWQALVDAVEYGLLKEKEQAK